LWGGFVHKMSWLTERYLAMCLLAQVILSLMNSLFNLSDLNAMIAIFGFYGLHQNAKNSFLLYIIFSLVSIVVDAARLALWGEYITTHLLGQIGSLGTYYIVLLCFGSVIKLVSCIFSYVIFKDLGNIALPPGKPKS